MTSLIVVFQFRSKKPVAIIIRKDLWLINSLEGSGAVRFKLIVSIFRTEIKILIAVHRRQSVYLTSKNWLKLNVLFVISTNRFILSMPFTVRLIFHNDFNMCMFIIAGVKNCSADCRLSKTLGIRKLFRREMIFCVPFDSINHW